MTFAAIQCGIATLAVDAIVNAVHRTLPGAGGDGGAFLRAAGLRYLAAGVRPDAS